MSSSCRVLILAATVASLIAVAKSSQPPYQASVRIHFHPKVPPVHICNAVIVHSRVVLTTASCIHYQFFPGGSSITIPASMLNILAGRSSDLSEGSVVGVATTIPSPIFNVTTLENDLAMLVLTTSLPLAYRNDMKWIILGDEQHSCLSDYNLGNNFYGPNESPFVPVDQCLKLSGVFDERTSDMCAEYPISKQHDYDSISDIVSLNVDRGTGLICKDHLIGLLSTILTPLEDTSGESSEMLTMAFYVNVTMHLDWIYETIFEAEAKENEEGDFSEAAPYQWQSDAIEEFSVPVSSSTVTPYFSQSTEAPIRTTPENAKFVQNSAKKQLRIGFSLLGPVILSLLRVIS